MRADHTSKKKDIREEIIRRLSHRFILTLFLSLLLLLVLLVLVLLVLCIDYLLPHGCCSLLLLCGV